MAPEELAHRPRFRPETGAQCPLDDADLADGDLLVLSIANGLIPPFGIPGGPGVLSGVY